MKNSQHGSLKTIELPFALSPLLDVELLAVRPGQPVAKALEAASNLMEGVAALQAALRVCGTALDDEDHDGVAWAATYLAEIARSMVRASMDAPRRGQSRSAR